MKNGGDAGTAKQRVVDNTAVGVGTNTGNFSGSLILGT
jgi:hypothetical protein